MYPYNICHQVDTACFCNVKKDTFLLFAINLKFQGKVGLHANTYLSEDGRCPETWSCKKHKCVPLTFVNSSPNGLSSSLLGGQLHFV